MKVGQARKLLEAQGLSRTASKVARVLAAGGIPHLFAGGFAIQEHGYYRSTLDVDVIVPDVAEAYDYLSIRGFKVCPGSKMTLKDRESGIEVDLLPGGGSVGPHKITFPIPRTVSSAPQFLTIEELISSKLSTYLMSPVNRAKDLGDVVELIKINKLPRTLKVAGEVAEAYTGFWDQLKNQAIWDQCKSGS